MEWSCSETVANILRRARKVVELTNSIKAWQQHNLNKWLPLILQFGSCCSAFYANVDADTAKLRKEAFLYAFRDLARKAG